ncbi:snoRNA-binding rRNA-processing protein [Zygosaccharomyces mellis]|uniref:SnoRNA-binding rRNA-processing protein n=1 Tax=Zygosaccharomyces mellis TaxID=42258 RepID=A0A4C2ED02_9SACH|nr:snoRNA-binding rRNA-processing protein [Zygosaccharomyces mellis]
MGRATNTRTRKQRHDPLLKDLDNSQGRLKKVKDDKAQKDQEDNEGDRNDYVDDKSSRRILQLAKDQQDEIADDEEKEHEDASNSRARFQMNYDNSDNEDEEGAAGQDISDFENEVDEADAEGDEVVQVDEEDAAIFNQYFKSSKDYDSLGGSYNLSDKIMASIREKEMETQEGMHYNDSEDQAFRQDGTPGGDGVALPDKVIRAYTAVGTILKTWTHGKLPKLFKVLPSLKNWPDVLYVTNPGEWSPHVIFEATKLFVSNLQAPEAQRFVNLVLLERFRENIETSDDHSLNYHLYRALKKSLYKPSAFFKGFLFPLVEGGCNIREATIAASVLAKVSVPVLHSSAALSYLLRLPFSPPTTVFIKVLLDKRYALPYQTVDDCVYYFMRFRLLDDGSNNEDATRVLPVVWHKAFLSFAQRYKNDITQDQRDFLLETVRQRGHKLIGPEIRRELFAGASREFVANPEGNDELMIDVK